MFPKPWENTEQGRSGYAPACSNEWVRGVCEKPKVRCGECPNQVFIAVEDRVIADHLGGKYTAGVYPLLPDDTCWFVALDFDEASWTAQLFDRYGDWPVAIAAYNAGAKKVTSLAARATSKSQMRTLVLAGQEEHARYVRSVMASVILIETPSLLE